MTDHNSNSTHLEGEEKKRTIWDLFSMTEGGHLKSTFLLYSFCLGFVYLAVYFFAYLLLLDPLEALVGGRAPVWLVNFTESLIPSVVGTALCLIPLLTAKDKRIIPAGFFWMAFYLLVMLVIMLVTLEEGDRMFFLGLYGMFVPVPVLMGCGLSVWLWLRQRDKCPSPHSRT